jgi:hypothetical protein
MLRIDRWSFFIWKQKACRQPHIAGWLRLDTEVSSTAVNFGWTLESPSRLVCAAQKANGSAMRPKVAKAPRHRLAVARFSRIKNPATKADHQRANKPGLSTSKLSGGSTHPTEL